MSGLELKIARIRKRMTQVELARATGIASTTLSAIENDRINPRAHELERILREIGPIADDNASSSAAAGSTNQCDSAVA